MTDRRFLGLGAGFVTLVALTWLAAFFVAPVDGGQGQVYRIIYLHVPSAFTAFASAAALAVTSIMGLRTRSESSLCWSKAMAETGLVFTILTLATGSIWGKPTWGTWWTWDARLTTTFLLALLYAGFLLLHGTLAPGPGRVRACGVLGIMICADVPIIYQSVNWWRTLHQPQSILRPDGASMDPMILTILLAAVVALIALGGWMATLRAGNLLLQDELESLTDARVAGPR